MKEKILHRCTRICLLVALGLFGYLGGMALSTAVAPTDAFARAECEYDDCEENDPEDGLPPEFVCYYSSLYQDCDAKRGECEITPCGVH